MFQGNNSNTERENFLKNIFEREREIEKEHKQGRGRGGDRGSGVGSVLTAASPVWGSNSSTVRS